MGPLSAEDRDLVSRAYEFAQSAHTEQKRYSGEPYFIHLFEVAKILAELGMGPKTIAAGLLHDTIEDADIDKAEFQAKFGDEILFLVDGVTKLGKIRYQGVKRHIGSLRKFFVSSSHDIRVLIIRLADRLHNMRTLEHVPKQKQARIAAETMEVYVPIADRLGIGKIKGELEDTAFKYLNPTAYNETAALSKAKYQESKHQLEKVYKKLVTRLVKEKITIIKTDYRRKGLHSLYRKLTQKGMDIDQVYDISALRVIVPTISDCYRVLGIIHSLWKPLPGRIKDYIASPKPNGYQSIHTTIFTGEGGIAEIQIRTEEMHHEAEYGIANHLGYKNSQHGVVGGTSWVKQFVPLLRSQSKANEAGDKQVPDWLKELAEAQSEIETPDEYMDALKPDFFSDRIFVFTPNGEVIDLPANATPIDFAYQIHSDIGDHIAGAKINSKLVSLASTLQNGDIVEINTKKSSHPTRKWLEYAKTTLAKRRIRSYLATSDPSHHSL
jgi:GTP pyrophosphokinase